jgi:hypothetical protein
MTTTAVSKLIESYLTELEGRHGFWRGLREEVPVYVFCDDENDRMRLMAPVGELRELDPAVLQVLLQANYDRALDAKYALRGREVWAVAVHPLATLAPDDFASFIDQVVRLVKNTGTTYASSDLVFLASGEGSDEPDAEGEGGEGEGGEGEGGEGEGGDGEGGDGHSEGGEGGPPEREGDDPAERPE